MKTFVFTKGDGPEMRTAKRLGKELEENGVVVEYFNTEEPDGVDKAGLYNIYSTPSFVVVRDDGEVVKMWRGSIPLKSDMEYVAKG